MNVMMKFVKAIKALKFDVYPTSGGHRLREVKYFNDPILTGVKHRFVKSIFGIYRGASCSRFNMLLK